MNRRKIPLRKMSSLAQLILFFFIILAISITVYVLVVKYFYWGGRNRPPDQKD